MFTDSQTDRQTDRRTDFAIPYLSSAISKKSAELKNVQAPRAAFPDSHGYVMHQSMSSPRGGGGARVGILTKVVEIEMGILTDDREIRVGNFDSIS